MLRASRRIIMPLLESRRRRIALFAAIVFLFALHQLLGSPPYKSYSDKEKLSKANNITTSKANNLATTRSKANNTDLTELYSSLLKTIPKHTSQAKCRPFQCMKNETQCDNIHPTNYDGPNPPCCTHILRDLMHIFDETMSTLGLDYVVSFGTLLGLTRSDKIIPWTGDNDVIIEDTKTAYDMVDLWKTTNASKSGLSLLFQGILRLCITPQFADGKIERWLNRTRTNCRGWLYSCEVPYIDFYVGKNISDDQYGPEMYQEIGNCKHYYKDIFPSQRRAVYNGTFSVNFPANPEQLLRTYYGNEWSVPPEKKDAHGLGWKVGECPFGPSHSSTNVQINEIPKHLQETNSTSSPSS